MMPPDDFNPPIGTPETVAPDVRRIVAPNPSPMTYRGTNTYLVGTQEVAVIDPGPQSDAHLEAILASIGPGARVSHILVTHTHLDHSPLARPLAEATGAPILAFGGADSGRSAVMQELAQAGEIGGGEGIDTEFTPDETLQDGQIVQGHGWTLEAIHTPGHIGNHLSFALGRTCFTADHVMGWASSLVSPPDGDLTDFMASCAKLSARTWDVFLPGHGAPITAPADRLNWLTSHRLSREASILAALEHGPATAFALAEAIYTETPPALLGAAARNVLAHLVDLYGKSLVAPTGALTAETIFRLNPEKLHAK
ncbi:MBL fold metallo-hydrolase [Aliishimia ponticola]|uniref:MBL fold metallo-hydrolase n=1 Tax=Aliishimia ponticola TaxID=2499833 RepID=A0A4S4NG68_9RHOB|nr:MBL fold metallo-hydrolase [Aliishimia ponticola]THH38614.1 MBL fold metallo-hydrolase [Aliishimia ponticola]